MVEVNKIKSLYNNGSHHFVILDFPSKNLIPFLLSNEYQYVWVVNYEVNLDSFDKWTTANLPISNQSNLDLLSRDISYDFILPTQEFKSIIPKLNNGLKIIQMNRLPPNYLDLRTIDGKTRYDLLQSKCDYLFEIDITYPTDYSTLIGSSKIFLESFLSNKELDFNNLP